MAVRRTARDARTAHNDSTDVLSPSQGRIFNKLALRSSHSDSDKSIFNISSKTNAAPRTLVQASTSSTASHYPARNDSDEKGRMSFLRRHRLSSTSAQKTDAPAGRKDLGPLGLRLLSAPAEPLIEIIFVHGLHGGSVKTWQNGSDPDSFWPQKWLPNETDFRNARIYSFGYETDFKSSEPSFLSVNDFGQALYEEIRSSPLLSRNPKVDHAVVTDQAAFTDRSNSHRTQSYSWHIPWVDLSPRRYVPFILHMPCLPSILLTHEPGTHPSLPRSRQVRYFEPNPGHRLPRYATQGIRLCCSPEQYPQGIWLRRDIFVTGVHKHPSRRIEVDAAHQQGFRELRSRSHHIFVLRDIADEYWCQINSHREQGFSGPR